MLIKELTSGCTAFFIKPWLQMVTIFEGITFNLAWQWIRLIFMIHTINDPYQAF